MRPPAWAPRGERRAFWHMPRVHRLRRRRGRGWTATPEAIVVGAGPAGVAAAAMLERSGVHTLVLESTDLLASPWHSHYDNLRLQSPSWMSHLPGLRFGRRYGMWVSRDGFIDYLGRYARHHGVEVEFGVTVTGIDRDAGGWRVSTSEGERAVPAVVVATGYNRVPVLPRWPGIDDFRGRIMHSQHYRRAADFRGRDVLVVGTGNSGGEIAYQLAAAGARRVRLSVRTPPNVVPLSAFGVPSLILAALLEPVPVAISDPILAAFNRPLIRDLSKHGLPRPQRGIYRQYIDTDVTPIIDTGFVGALRERRIEPVAAVAGFERDHVRLADASRIAPEVVIAATGYRRGLERLVGKFGVLRPDGRPVVDGGHRCPGAPGLHFIGYTHPFSGNLRRIKRDAPRLARAIVDHLDGRAPEEALAAAEPPPSRSPLWRRPPRGRHRPARSSTTSASGRASLRGRTVSRAGEVAAPAVPSGEETFGIATIPIALERAAESGRGLTLVDRNLDATPLPYALLAARARRAAARLARKGVEPGDRVCLVSSTSAEMLIALFGIWRALAVPVILPLPARASEVPTAAEELRRRSEDVDARAIVVSEAMSGLVAASGLGRPTLSCGELAGERSEMTEPAAAVPDDLAYLQFTSGTTSRSRAVALTHRQMLCNMAGLWSAYPIPPEESIHASWLPLFHDMGLLSLLTSVACTGRMVVQPPEEFLRKPRSWVEGISRFGATSTAAPNFSYALATLGLRTGTAQADLSTLRIAGNGAEPIDVATLDGFAAAAAPYGLREEAMSPMYGLAEATLAVCVAPADRPLARETVDRELLEVSGVAREVEPGADGARVLAACGPPIPGCEVRICDADGRELGEREVGEICVRSPSVMSGYWNDPEATAEALRDGWLRTGDLGYIGGNGLVVCGRIKDMIIVGGRNLYPEDYEHVAQQVPGTRPASVAFALVDSERMVVAIEPSSHSRDHEELAGRVMQTLCERLAHAPERVLVVQRQSIPRTSSGKTKRQAARQQLDADELPILATATR